MVKTKTCTGCKVVYEENTNNFWHRSGCKSGYYAKCKNCLKERNIKDCKKMAKSLKGIFSRYKSDAKKNNRVFDLTISQVEDFILADCSYCGRFYTNYIGIDRVDNTQGYTLHNCVSCCFECNRAKATMTKDQFIAMCIAVAKHHQLL